MGCNKESGIDYTSSQNPWSNTGDGDAGFSDFEIFDINDGINAVDLRVKFRIESIFDDSGANVVVYNGTKWTLAEILNPGTGFSVGQVFALTTPVRLKITLSQSNTQFKDYCCWSCISFVWW